jgi:Domain of unknown function (DUF4440)
MKHATLATLAASMLCLSATGQRSVTADEVMKVDEQFRLAKLNRDTSALGLILAETFHETNQNGNGRNKAQTIELWASFPIESLTTDSADVKITGDTAVVTGSQTEHNGSGVDRMLYMRVYVRDGSRWQLLAAMQFRDPRL